MCALKMHIYSSKLSNTNQTIYQNMNFNINILRCLELPYTRIFRKANEHWPREQRIRNEEREETLQIFRRMCTATPYDGSDVLFRVHA
jgi:hypothetical protein